MLGRVRQIVFFANAGKTTAQIHSDKITVDQYVGIGFPPFRGGAFRWMDSIGLKAFCELADKYSLGKLYEPTEKQREMAAKDQKYYG